MNLEDELRAALRRTEPPADFTARVLAARPAVKQWPRWVAALAASILLAVGTFEYRQYQGERAKSQVMLAVRIAASKLNKAQKRIQMMHVHRSNS